MLISGLLIVLGIPIVWLKPSLNVSESFKPKRNDTSRTKRQPEFYDFIHRLIEKHANCADQQLAPLKPFGNFKPYETFVYPNGFTQLEQQFVGVPHTSTCTQVKICPKQQQQRTHTHTVFNHDPDVLNYLATSKKLKPIVVAKEKPRFPSFITGTSKNLTIHSNGYRLRKNNPRRNKQVGERNRQIFCKGVQKQNSNISIINGQNNSTDQITEIKTPIVKSIETSARAKANILASGGPVNATCTCPNLLPTNNSSFNFAQNLNLLVQELEGMANFNNQTEALHKNATAVNGEDILRMLEKFKALQSSVPNKTPVANRTRSDDKNGLLKMNLTETTTSEPLISTPEISTNTTNFKNSSNIDFEATTLEMENFVTTSTIRIETNSTEIINSNDSIENDDQTFVQNSSLALIKIEDNEFGRNGVSALTLAPKDLVKITDKLKNVANDLNNKTLPKSPHENPTNVMKINDFDTFANLNPLTEAETAINVNSSLKQSLQNTTLPPEILENTTNFQISDNSSLTNSSMNISFTNNGSFKKIHTNQQSLQTSNKRRNTNKGSPNARTFPSDMTGTSSRFIKYLRQNASSSLAGESYAEPIVSEIYPAKMNKSPLSIYLHRIVDKSKISHFKPPRRNWIILKSGESDSDNDDISTLSKDCEDYEDSSELAESQQLNKNLKPKRFRELFNYDANLT